MSIKIETPYDILNMMENPPVRFNITMSDISEEQLFLYLLDNIKLYFEKPANQFKELKECYLIKDQEDRKKYQEKLLDEIKSLTL